MAGTTPFITTPVQATLLGSKCDIKNLEHSILRSFVERCGLKNPDAALAITLGIRAEAFGGRELRESIAMACRQAGVDFDPYLFKDEDADRLGAMAGTIPDELAIQASLGLSPGGLPGTLGIIGLEGLAALVAGLGRATRE